MVGERGSLLRLPARASGRMPMGLVKHASLAMAVAAVAAMAAVLMVARNVGGGLWGGGGGSLLQRVGGRAGSVRGVKDVDPLSARQFSIMGQVAEGTVLRGIRDELRGGVAEMGMGGRRGMPTLAQIRKERRAEKANMVKIGRVATRHGVVDCEGRSEAMCDLALDAKAIDAWIATSGGQGRDVGGSVAEMASPGVAQELMQMGMGGDAEREEVGRLLRQNRALRRENARLEGGHLLAQEEVPATVTAPPPGPADFNGHTAIIARPPLEGFASQHTAWAQSVLQKDGRQSKGSFRVRKANPYGGIMYRVWGAKGHDITCTIKGYRRLSGDFKGNTGGCLR